MLTAKENMRQAIIGGNPDRFVNQYEGVQLLFDPFSMFHNPMCQKGQENIKNAWGVYYSFPENTPGGFPVHTPEKIVVKDIENWKEYVHAPVLDIPQEEWDQAQGMYDAVDSEKSFKATFVAPGLFEQTHHLCSIDKALLYYVMYPDEMKDMIKYITEFELKYAEGICSHLHPDVIFHHDDWGSETNSFLRPEMFEDCFLDCYKQIYGYYHDHGVEFVIHHSDSYAANLVPYMIEMGIDVWQGCMESNDVPGLLKKYAGQIAFMGNIDNKAVDFDGWTQADCEKATLRALEGMPLTSYIPCITQGGPGSVYPGTYAGITQTIDEYNEKKFGFTKEQQEEQRMPLQILF